MLASRRALALLALLACALVPPAAADVSLVLPIAGNVVFENGEFTFRDSLVVLPGSTLTFRNATVWLDAARLCTGHTNIPGAYRCQPHLNVHGGHLVIENSTVSAHRWDGEDIDSGYILQVERGSAEIRDSRFTHYRQINFVQPGLGPSVVEGNRFFDASGPIRFMQGVEGSFRGNVVEDTRDGVWVSDATVPVEWNVFRQIDREFGTGGAGYAIWILASSPADRTWPTLAPIRGNLLENGQTAILNQNAFPNVVEDNVIRNFRSGLIIAVQPDSHTFPRQPPIVQRNLIEDTYYAISIGANTPLGPPVPSPKVLDLSGNALVGTRCRDIWFQPLPSALRLEVDATGVWWGNAKGPVDHGPGCPAIRVDAPQAVVDVDDWLRHEPSWTLALRLPATAATHVG